MVATRIVVSCRQADARAVVLLNSVKRIGFNVEELGLNDVFTVSSSGLNNADLERIGEAFSNSVIQLFSVGKPLMPKEFDYVIEIGFLPGVTDNAGNTAVECVGDLFKEKKLGDLRVYSSREIFLKTKLNETEINKLANSLANPLIQRINIKNKEKFLNDNGMDVIEPIVKLAKKSMIKEINLNVNQEELIKIGKHGVLEEINDFGEEIRNGPLALDLTDIIAIRDYFNSLNRKPTDVELESLAQTWSEHCKHTIFAAELDEIKNGLFKELIRDATEKIRKEKGLEDNCVSVFVDNSGAIIFDETNMVTDKVETHNSPSALDPFGGAITGIVGVNRDAIGFGLGAKPIVNRFGFCFAEPKDTEILYRGKNCSNPILSPERVMLGVIDGVKVGGNCSGIPTPQGFMYFDERFKGKPLVFVGTIGLMPRKNNGKKLFEKKAMPGDIIVVVGGKVGKDGIHGATFSSEALSSGSPATAVQIGDPITQKKLSDAIVKEARDKELYNSITDNGAGGLSCSIAEMAKESNGCHVLLEKVPLKYPGLQPWETWISESQERMTLAVPKEKLLEFNELMQSRGVESTIIGEFTDTGKCIVEYNGKKIMDIELNFLHNGLPAKHLKTIPLQFTETEPIFPEPANLNEMLNSMLSRLNICGKEFIAVQYDHEVQGSSVLKPLIGEGRVNAEATIVRPILDSFKGIGISHSLNPRHSDIDCYWMAANSIDSSIKNLVSVGCNLKEIVLLDNFCWCSSDEAERLWQLKQAVKACHDFAIKFKTPFISGKDSMFNDFKGFDKNSNPIKISVPPTLLISSLAKIEDVRKAVSMDAKFAGDLIYIIGLTKNELGASEYYSLIGEKLAGKRFTGNSIPKVNAEKAILSYNKTATAIEKELIASIQPIGLGGIGAAISKKCIAGNLGAIIHLSKIPTENIARNDFALFSESASRLLVTIDSKNKKAFEATMNGTSFALIGEIIEDKKIVINGINDNEIANVSLRELEESYKKPLRDY